MPSDGPRVHGLSSSLYIGDEVWAWPANGELLEAMQTGLIKRPDAKLLAIGTAAARLDSPLGRLRARALAQPTAKRKGAVVEAAAKDLRRQRAALPDAPFAQFHACRWGHNEGSWLPAGAWQACVGQPRFEDGEPIRVGVDVGGDRSASAVLWINEQVHVGCAIYHGDSGVLECPEQVRELAGQYGVREVVFDPWRFGQVAQELQRERVPARLPTDRRADDPGLHTPARGDR